MQIKYKAKFLSVCICYIPPGWFRSHFRSRFTMQITFLSFMHQEGNCSSQLPQIISVKKICPGRMNIQMRHRQEGKLAEASYRIPFCGPASCDNCCLWRLANPVNLLGPGQVIIRKRSVSHGCDGRIRGGRLLMFFMPSRI